MEPARCRGRGGGGGEGSRREERRKRGEKIRNMADEFIHIRISMLAYMWQMYSIHTKIRWYTGR